MQRSTSRTFTAVIGSVYAALMSNLLLVLGCAPLVRRPGGHRPGAVVAAARAGRAAVRARRWSACSR